MRSAERRRKPSAVLQNKDSVKSKLGRSVRLQLDDRRQKKKGNERKRLAKPPRPRLPKRAADILHIARPIGLPLQGIQRLQRGLDRQLRLGGTGRGPVGRRER